MSALPRIDYHDAFLTDPGADASWTPEMSARAMLEGAPVSTRAALVSGWASLGLRHDSIRSERSVLGWPVRRNSADLLLLGADSRLGLPAELLFMRYREKLLFATLMQHKNPLARAMWAGIAPGHRRIVRRLLEDAAARRDRETQVEFVG